jgi:hypothetical protein
MGNPAGVKRNFEALEKRRLKAFKLLDAGVPQAGVARRVGEEFLVPMSRIAFSNYMTFHHLQRGK